MTREYEELLEISFSGKPIKLICPRDQLIRMGGTCFRGKGKPLANNFRLWNNMGELLADTKVRKVFSDTILEILTKYLNPNNEYSTMIEYDQPVGWASTISSEQVKKSEVETFYPNRNSEALRMRDKTAPAPYTHLITFVFRVSVGPTLIKVIVYSVYPGRDVGRLEGHISKRESVVFYPFDNPGTDDPNFVAD